MFCIIVISITAFYTTKKPMKNRKKAKPNSGNTTITISHVSRGWQQLTLGLPFLSKIIHLGLCSDQIREYPVHSQSHLMSSTEIFPRKMTIMILMRSWLQLASPCSLTMCLNGTHCMFTQHLPKQCWPFWDTSGFFLLHVSLMYFVYLGSEDYLLNSLEWHVTIFNENALLLNTVHLCGIALSNCYFSPTTAVELEVDARGIPFGIIHHKVFTHMAIWEFLTFGAPSFGLMGKEILYPFRCLKN